MRNRVVITGLGCVTPLGSDVHQVWNRLTEGQSGVGRLTIFDASRFPVQIAAEVKDWSIAEVGEDPSAGGIIPGKRCSPLRRELTPCAAPASKTGIARPNSIRCGSAFISAAAKRIRIGTNSPT